MKSTFLESVGESNNASGFIFKDILNLWTKNDLGSSVMTFEFDEMLRCYTN